APGAGLLFLGGPVQCRGKAAAATNRRHARGRLAPAEALPLAHRRPDPPGDPGHHHAAGEDSHSSRLPDVHGGDFTAPGRAVLGGRAAVVPLYADTALAALAPHRLAGARRPPPAGVLSGDEPDLGPEARSARRSARTPGGGLHRGAPARSGAVVGTP